MKLVKCKTCGSDVGNQAITCPSCGNPGPKALRDRAFKYLVLLACFVIFFAMFFGNFGKGQPDAVASNLPSGEVLSDYVGSVNRQTEEMENRFLSAYKQFQVDQRQGDAAAELSHHQTALNQMQAMVGEVSNIKLKRPLTSVEVGPFHEVEKSAYLASAEFLEITKAIPSYAINPSQNAMTFDAIGSKAKAAQDAFADAVFRAYDAFGVPRDRIDPRTLQLKR